MAVKYNAYSKLMNIHHTLKTINDLLVIDNKNHVACIMEQNEDGSMTEIDSDLFNGIPDSDITATSLLRYSLFQYYHG